MSYSRRDRGTVARLVEALRARGKTVWVDLEDIIPSSKWMAEIRSAIAASDTVIATISPDSAISAVCREEASIALSLPKRVVPVVLRETPVDQVLPGLAELSFLFFTPAPGQSELSDADFDHYVDRLVQVLDTDIEDVHVHSEMLRRASEWHARGEPRTGLLRGRDLDQAEDWQASHTGRNPAITPVQRQYILASRNAATKRQRAWAASATVLALVMALLVGVAVAQAHNAREATAVAVRQRDAAVSAQEATESASVMTADPQLGLLLALHAYGVSPTSQAEQAVRQAVARSPVRALWPAPKPGQDLVGTAVISPGAFDPSGHFVVAVRGPSLVEVHAVPTGSAAGPDSHRTWSLSTASWPGFDLTSATFTSAGTVLVRGSYGHGPQEALALWAWRWRQGGAPALVGRFPDASLVSPNGKWVAAPARGGIKVEALSSPHRSVFVKTAASPLAVSDDGGMLAGQSQVPSTTAVGATSVTVWSLPSGKRLRTSTLPLAVTPSPAMDQSEVAFSPDNRYLALGSLEIGVLDLRQAGGPVVVHTLSLPAGLSPHVDDVNSTGAVAWSASDVLAAGAEDDYVRVWTSPTAAPVFLASQQQSWSGVAFSPDGQFLASGSLDGTTQVWQWEAPSSPVLPVAALSAVLSPNGDEVAVGTQSGWALLWDWQRQSVFFLAPGVPLAFSPNGQQVVVDDAPANQLAVFDLGRRRPVATMLLPIDATGSVSAQFSPDGRSLALLVTRQDALGQPYVNLATWAWPHGAAKYWQEGWLPDQAVLLAYSQRKGVEVISGTGLYHWDGRPDSRLEQLAKNVASMDELGSAVLLPGGRRILEAVQGQAEVVDLPSGRASPILTGYSDQGVSTGVFALDQRQDLALFTGSSGYLATWDLRPRDPPVIVTALTSGAAASISIDAAGDVIAAAASSGVHVFSCQYCGPFGQVLALARARVVRSLTTQERDAFILHRSSPGQVMSSLVQAPVVSEAPGPPPPGRASPAPGGSPAQRLLELLPWSLGPYCRVVLSPAPPSPVGAQVQCHGARGHLGPGSPVGTVTYSSYPSATSLDQAFLALVPKAGRHVCGGGPAALVGSGGCAYQQAAGLRGRAALVGASGAGARLVWTLQRPGSPPVLVVAQAATGASPAQLAAWWAAQPLNWLAPS